MPTKKPTPSGPPKTYEQRLLGNIEKYGWQATSVVDPEGNAPAFCYSIGFSKTIRSPEAIVFGLDTDVMHAMLDKIFAAVRAGATFSEGQRWHLLIEGEDCIARAVHPTNYVPDYFNSALWFHQRANPSRAFEALQIFWPDDDGRFPWDGDCAPDVRDAQPQLSRPR